MQQNKYFFIFKVELLFTYRVFDMDQAKIYRPSPKNVKKINVHMINYFMTSSTYKTKIVHSPFKILRYKMFSIHIRHLVLHTLMILTNFCHNKYRMVTTNKSSRNEFKFFDCHFYFSLVCKGGRKINKW